MQREIKTQIQRDYARILQAISKEPQFIIQIPPITKKNSQQIIYRNGKPCIIPSKQYREYEKSAGYFLRPVQIDYGVNILYLFYMPTRRRVDEANLVNAADDILVKYGVITDDNSKIVVSHDGTRVLYDKENPRTEIYITRLDLTSF